MSLKIYINGKADSRIAKYHLKNMMFAIEDYRRIKQANILNTEKNETNCKLRKEKQDAKRLSRT